jgi:putative transposase
LAIAWFSDAREEARPMPKKGHTEEEILPALRKVEAGETAVAVCRQDGISQQMLYLWKKHAGLGLSELRELRQLREENRKPKGLVADLSLDRHILQELVAQKAGSLAPSGSPRPGGIAPTR